jgi:vancomycin resistance protein VanJ
MHSLARRLRGLIRYGWFLVQIAIVLYGLAMFVYIVARITVGENWNLIAFANAFLPWLAWFGMALALVALLSRYRGLLIAVQMPIVFTFLILYSDMLLPRNEPEPVTGPDFTAATYNILSHQSNPDFIIHEIGRMDVDIVGLQEVGEGHAAQIEETLADAYPYRVLEPRDPAVNGIGLLSRYPVLDVTLFKPMPSSSLHLRAVLDVEGTSVTVFVSHAEPASSRYAPLLYDDSRRDSELEILRRDYVESELNPVLLLCDCNMTDQSDAYRALDRVMDEAFRRIGRGMGFTFPDHTDWVPPLMRLDQIWYSDQLVARKAMTWNRTGTSLHRPVWAALALKQ